MSLRADTVEPALAPIVGASAAMRALRSAVRRAAREGGPVLIQGETGTGKELVARALRDLRGRGPFHAVNCSTLEPLADSQLFGHARGAFTSADHAVRGAIEQAGDGVLFLDEIGDLPWALQPKLLRALEGSPVQPLGDERWFELKARLVAASHVELDALVAEGRFREDLYYRLAIHVIRVPPLREHTEDIRGLAEVMLRKLTHPKAITEEAIVALGEMAWPGNVRQLAGFLQRLAAHAERDAIDMYDVLDVAKLDTAALRRARRPLAQDHAEVGESPKGMPGSFDARVDEYARSLIENALLETHGNVSAAARVLGLGRMALVRRMRRYWAPRGRSLSDSHGPWLWPPAATGEIARVNGGRRGKIR